MHCYNYNLDKENCSWRNALPWGNFAEHCKKAGEGSLGHRVVHTLIAILELLPIIGLITSIIEKLIASCFTLPPHPPYDRAKAILKKALTSKDVKILYKEANSTPTLNYKSGARKTGAWKIAFVDNTANGFRAECVYWQRRIDLLSNLSDEEALTLFVFELTNAISSAKHFELYNKAYLGQIECEEYIKESERIEHEGSFVHHQVISKAIKKMGWSEALDIYRYMPRDFEIQWNFIKDSSHADFYRKCWNFVTDYNKKHVKHSNFVAHTTA